MEVWVEARSPRMPASPRARRNDVPERLEAFPRRLDGRAFRFRDVNGFLLQLEMRNVTRTVGENVLRRDPQQRLRAGNLRNGDIIEGDFSTAVDTKPPPLFAGADEEEPDMGIDAQIAEAAKHAVAVVIGKRQLILGDDLHESRRSALERTVGATLAVRRCKEEERRAFDEAFVVVAESRPMGVLDEPIGERAAAETLLQFTLPRMVHVVPPESALDFTRG